MDISHGAAICINWNNIHFIIITCFVLINVTLTRLKYKINWKIRIILTKVANICHDGRLWFKVFVFGHLKFIINNIFGLLKLEFYFYIFRPFYPYIHFWWQLFLTYLKIHDRKIYSAHTTIFVIIFLPKNYSYSFFLFFSIGLWSWSE